MCIKESSVLSPMLFNIFVIIYIKSKTENKINHHNKSAHKANIGNCVKEYIFNLNHTYSFIQFPSTVGFHGLFYYDDLYL